MPYDSLVDSARLNKALTATANAIRAKTGADGQIGFDMDNGFANDIGGLPTIRDVDIAFEEGMTAERKAMWDMLLYNGKRTNLDFAFYCPKGSDPMWTNDTFDPPYDLAPSDANRMFRGFGVTDMPALLNRLGRIIDFSKCTSMPYVFYGSTRLEKCCKIVVNKDCSNFESTFANCENLETVEIELQDGCNTKWTNTFVKDYKLKNIVITGGSIKNSINLQWSKDLTVESAKNIMLHLDGAASVMAETWPTVKFAPEVWEKLDALGADVYDVVEGPITWREYLEYMQWNY